MPTLEWNARWREDLARWQRQEADEPFGNHWGDPEELECLSAVRDRFLLPFVDARKTALEIGCGGGRWTQYLLEVQRLYCVDVHPEMFHYVLERFGAQANVSFCQSSGSDLPGIAPGSVDFAFSFGTFVHLDPPLIEGYLASLHQVLAPGADLVLQYAEKGKEQAAANLGFANTTARSMRRYLARASFEIVDEDLNTLPHSNVVHARPV